MAPHTRSWIHALFPAVFAVAAAGCDDPTATLSSAASLRGSSSDVVALVTTGNPMLPGDKPDPHIAVLDGKYWLYPTGGGQFRAYSSFDLTNWVDEGVVLDLGPGVSWTDRNGWAPAIVFRNGKYYFYYSANGPAPDSKIGVAVGDSPRGPFVDKGTPLVHSTSTVEAIDPMVFVDDDGQAYLYYGGSAGSNLAIVKLNADMTSLAGTPVVRTPSYFTEAPFMHKRNGTYYLTYSNGRWYDASYNVRYATATSPMGPWTYRAQILSSNTEDKGPGHHSVLQRPGTDQWHLVYHRWENNNFSAGRSTAIDRLTYATDGLLQRVVMTNTGVGASPLVVADGRYRLIAKHSNKALDVAGCSTADGADVIVWPYAGRACQQWDFVNLGNGYYKVTAANSGYALEVAGCSATDGADVIVGAYSGSGCEQWQVVATGDNAWRLVARNSGKALDVGGCSTADGADAILWPYWGGDCQRWRIEKP